MRSAPSINALCEPVCAADSPPIRTLRQEEIDALPCKCWYFKCYKDTDALPQKNVLDSEERKGLRDHIDVMPGEPTMRQIPVWHESAQYGRVHRSLSGTFRPRVDS